MLALFAVQNRPSLFRLIKPINCSAVSLGQEVGWLCRTGRTHPGLWANLTWWQNYQGGTRRTSNHHGRGCLGRCRAAPLLENTLQAAQLTYRQAGSTIVAIARKLLVAVWHVL